MGNTGPSMVGTPSFHVLIDDSHRYTDVVSTSDKTVGGAHTLYGMRTKDGRWLGGIEFQDGPIKVAGINGVMDENLLAIVIDRLKGFQSGNYACSENAFALGHLESALDVLKQRTQARIQRGVEGTHQI